MLSTAQKNLFDTCLEALVHVQGRGLEKSHKDQIEVIVKVNDFLYHTVHEITAARPLGKRHEWVRVIIARMHPDTDYNIPEIVARDLLDVCITLSRVLESKLRKTNPGKKIMDAQTFCDYAAHGID